MLMKLKVKLKLRFTLEGMLVFILPTYFSENGSIRDLN